MLLPGDQLFIPGIDIGQIERPTGGTHRITVSTAATEIELILVFRDHEGSALKDESYELTFEHEGKTEKKTGELSGSGELHEKVPVSLMTADLLLTKSQQSFQLQIGELDPAHEGETGIESGALARLAALGFMAREPGVGPLGDLRSATRAFQKEKMGQTDPTGDLDSQTCAKLEEIYGV